MKIRLISILISIIGLMIVCVILTVKLETLKEQSCPDISEPEIVEVIITKIIEAEPIVETEIEYQTLYEEVIVYEEVIKEVPAICPACICNEKKECEDPEEYLEAKTGMTKLQIDRAITSEIKKSDPLGKEYLDYLIRTRNEYDELIKCK